jgi:hypothetical protein
MEIISRKAFNLLRHECVILKISAIEGSQFCYVSFLWNAVGSEVDSVDPVVCINVCHSMSHSVLCPQWDCLSNSFFCEWWSCILSLWLCKCQGHPLGHWKFPHNTWSPTSLPESGCVLCTLWSGNNWAHIILWQWTWSIVWTVFWNHPSKCLLKKGSNIRFFLQDNIVAHTSQHYVEALCEIFVERIVNSTVATSARF